MAAAYQEKLNRFRILHVTKWLMIVTAFILFSSSMVIAIDGLNDRVIKTDLVVVPGNTVNPDGTLSARLKGRLDAALNLFREGHCKYILVSGATGVEGVDEAHAMKMYLLQQGVPDEKIIQDSFGFNTAATAKKLL